MKEVSSQQLFLFTFVGPGHLMDLVSLWTMFCTPSNGRPRIDVGFALERADQKSQNSTTIWLAVARVPKSQFLNGRILYRTFILPALGGARICRAGWWVSLGGWENRTAQANEGDEESGGRRVLEVSGEGPLAKSENFLCALARAESCAGQSRARADRASFD